MLNTDTFFEMQMTIQTPIRINNLATVFLLWEKS